MRLQAKALSDRDRPENGGSAWMANLPLWNGNV
jgi:hypothetical protein